MDCSERENHTSPKRHNSFHNQGHFQSEFSKRIWSSQCLGFQEVPYSCSLYWEDTPWKKWVCGKICWFPWKCYYLRWIYLEPKIPWGRKVKTHIIRSLDQPVDGLRGHVWYKVLMFRRKYFTKPKCLSCISSQVMPIFFFFFFFFKHHPVMLLCL